jgi:hypothetical protein
MTSAPAGGRATLTRKLKLSVSRSFPRLAKGLGTR